MPPYNKNCKLCNIAFTSIKPYAQCCSKKCTRKKYRINNLEKELIQNRAYREKNRDIIIAKDRKFRNENREFVRNKRREKYLKNKDKENARSKQWQKDNPERAKAIKKRTNLKNRDKIIAYSREYYKKNRETRINFSKKYIKERRKIDINFNLRFILRSRITKCIKNKKNTTMQLLGADIKTVRKHLESQFKEGMSWDNHSFTGWHIDHIIPISSFDLTDLEQQKKCFHYTNLQPLWAKDNFSKGSKIL
jgi:hypothetical protein